MSHQIQTRDAEALLDSPIYPVAEAARLVGLHPTRVHRWLHGYEYRFSLEGEESLRRQEPLVRREGTAGTTYTSFLDLIDLVFIKQFLDHRVSLQKLRKALDEAADLLGTNHFARQTFFTNGRDIYLKVKEHGDAILELLSGGQWVIPDVIVQLSHRIEFDAATGFARRWYPRDRSGLVVLDPAISFGSPRLMDRGIATANVYDLYKAEKGDTNRVCFWTGLTEKEVEAAVDFEKSLAA